MKFHIRQDEIQEALQRINKSKALAPINDEVLSSLLIDAKKENDKPIVTFTATNGAMWSVVSVDSSEFLDSELPNNFDVEKCGRVFVEGQSFIDMVSTYPTGIVISFESEEQSKEEPDGKSLKFLKIDSKRLKKGRVKKSGFSIKNIDNFPEFPQDEERKEMIVKSSALLAAIKSVEFASSGNEKFPELSGCKIEIYGEDDIAACATDKKRICWHDVAGVIREDDRKPKMTINPISSSLVSSIDNLILSDSVKIESGLLYTIISQKNQKYTIPNVASPGSFPDWRFIVNKITEERLAEIKISKKILSDFFRSALSTVASKFGMRFEFDTVSNDKKVILAIDRIETGNILTSYHLEEEPLNDKSFSGEAIGGVIVQIDEFRDAVSRISGDIINIRVKDSLSPLEIYGEDDKQFKYILSTISPSKNFDKERGDTELDEESDSSVADIPEEELEEEENVKE